MKQNKLHNKPLVFDSNQTQQIDRCLLRLADQIGSPLVMVADISGQLVLYRGRLSASQGTGLAALGAGSFAAGLEIGNFLGLKSSFQHQLLEGRLANLYILAVGPELLLIVAFTDKTTLGMVRMFARQAQNELLALAQVASIERENMVESTEQLDEGFNDELRNQLDELFASGLD